MGSLGWKGCTTTTGGAPRRSDRGLGAVQGGSISPLLANLYLHYVFDLWVQRWRGRARGDVIVVRFADDFVVGFEHHDEAERCLTELRERFAQFSLELHPDKTRLIEFGRLAARNRKRRGEGKPSTFDFLGFMHACGQNVGPEIQGASPHCAKAVAGQARGGGSHAPQAPALAGPEARGMAGIGRSRARRIFRRAGQRPSDHLVPVSGRGPLDTRHEAPQPGGSHDLGADDETDRPLAPTREDLPPLAAPAARRGSAPRSWHETRRAIITRPTRVSRSPRGARAPRRSRDRAPSNHRRGRA